MDVHNQPFLLAHVNYIMDAELQNLSRTAHSVVYCPRSHGYFQHPPHSFQKMLALGINEAALMIEEGICDRPQEMDLAMIYGTGFPPYRGGILRYADKWGLKNVYQKLLELEKQYGPRFQPADLVKEMAKAGKTFYRE